MGKLCMECLDTFKNDAVTSVHRISPYGLYQECPKRICDGKIFNIDDTILPTIQLLNQKGYATISSCGGHAESEVPKLYVEFDESVKSFPFAPVGFKVEAKRVDNTTRLIVSYEVDSEDMYDIFPELLGAAEMLYDWAEELDVIFDYSMVFFGMDSLKDFLANGTIAQASEEDVKRIKAEKIKEAAPTGTIKLDLAEKEEVPAEAEAKNEATPLKEEEEVEKPKRKRGRPKKEDK